MSLLEKKNTDRCSDVQNTGFPAQSEDSLVSSEQNCHIPKSSTASETSHLRNNKPQECAHTFGEAQNMWFPAHAKEGSIMGDVNSPSELNCNIYAQTTSITSPATFCFENEQQHAFAHTREVSNMEIEICEQNVSQPEYSFTSKASCSKTCDGNDKQQFVAHKYATHFVSSSEENGMQNKFSPELPDITFTNSHVVMFHIPMRKGKLPRPYPYECKKIVWDRNHVKMPFASDSSFFHIWEKDNKRRWQLIHEALYSPIPNSFQLQKAICSYNPKYHNNYTFANLHAIFSLIPKAEERNFFEILLPDIIQLALNLESVVTGPIPLLKKHQVKSLSFSQQQIACLLANAFLCTFPDRDSFKTKSEYYSYPNINFSSLFSSMKRESACCAEKLRCIINYFRRVCSSMPDGVVTYSRLYVQPEKVPKWSFSSSTLPSLDIRNSGTIEDADGLLQVDFANKMVGGGILDTGCVQEEIRFAICPELILARLFTEELDNTEALLITGCERFSKYKGYGPTFSWAGDYVDKTPRDSSNRRKCSVIAIDAIRFKNKFHNFNPKAIERELNKAYVGFHNPHFDISALSPVATGNWGCGAFGGDVILKALIQLMAAAESRPHVVYFTFESGQLKDDLRQLHDVLTSHHITVAKLWRLLLQYCEYYNSYGKVNHIESLHSYLLQAVTLTSKH